MSIPRNRTQPSTSDASPRPGRRDLALASLLLLAVADAAGAPTLRCGDRLVRDGDSEGHLRAHCGEPDGIDREVKHFRDGGSLGRRCFSGSVAVERWRYERGRGRIPATVTVVEGEVEQIRLETGGFEPGWRSPCR